MSFHNLTSILRTARVMNAVGAGTGDEQNSSSVDIHPAHATGTADTDLEGNGVRFIVALGAIAATGVATVRIEGSADDAAWSTVTTADAPADTDDNKLVVIDAYRPRYRFLRCVVKRETANVTIDSVVAEVYHMASAKPAKHTTVAVEKLYP